ncbi:MAG: permease [Gemmatimonadota bacterium]|nr:permease [Gemmatimonadota bacterium]
MTVLLAIGHALWMAFAMFWQILWPLILGFTISGVVQAVVSKDEVVRRLGSDRPRALAWAAAFGAASSSCSYAAVAIARSLFRKGADFTAAMVFEIASTNLVLELTIVLIVFLGWQFALAEVVGAVVMIGVLALLFRRMLSPALIGDARAQADRGIAGRMEGHAGMHMTAPAGDRLFARIRSAGGRTAVSHYFVMDWVSVWIDVAGGLLIAGALAAWVPRAWWAQVFMVSHPTLARVWGPLIGPIIAMLSFVCSVGNIPLAAVLWNGGISFGGVTAFIFADLLVLPILDIYRRYYGRRMTWRILVGFYVAMVVAAFVVEGAFGALGLVPHAGGASAAAVGISVNYTTVLNVLFLLLAAALVRRFLRTGGPAMLRMMAQPVGAATGAPHEHHHGA